MTGAPTSPFNGGRSWSTQRNQVTAQFYRVIADNQFPYNVYGGQQDNSAIGIASQAPGGIDWKDWYSVAGCESAYLAFDPNDPEDVFGGCYQGLISVWNRTTGTQKGIQAYQFLGLGTEPIDQKYRFNWNAPIVASAHDPNVIYHAGNVVLRTEDRGQSWTEISPDLTRDEEEKQGLGGRPITNEAAGGENYNTIMYLAESPHDPRVLWTGSDDGLVYLTQDGGATWNDVTPSDIGEAIINSIEISPHNPAKAYIVVTKYKFNDFTPYIYRTDDFGNSWDRIADGIDENAWVRVVREDPARPGLLYAGTETGFYVSFNDGDQWEQWQANLPVVPITDLIVHNNDLVVSTQGRAFWILDDLSAVQQHTPETFGTTFRLLQPRAHHLVRFGSGGGGGGGDEIVGRNAPGGVQLFAWLADAPDSLATLEILRNGQVIRTYATNPTAYGDSTVSQLNIREGFNRIAWDFRTERIPAVPGLFVFGNLAGRTVSPGQYTARLTVQGESQSVNFDLRPDPRISVPTGAFAAQEQFIEEAGTMLSSLHQSVTAMQQAQSQVDALIGRLNDHPEADRIEEAGNALTDSIHTWADNLVQPKQETFQDVINFQNKLSAQILALIGSVDGTTPPVTQGAQDRLLDLRQEWNGHRDTFDRLVIQLRAFNQLLRDLNVPGIVVETPRPPAVSLRD